MLTGVMNFVRSSLVIYIYIVKIRQNTRKMKGDMLIILRYKRVLFHTNARKSQ
jgi:hypothetical protein